MSARPRRASRERRTEARVELRTPAEAGREALGGLLDGLEGDELSAIVRREDGGTVGALAYRLRDGWLAVEGVAVVAGAQGRGFDAEAVRLLEEDAESRGVARWFGFAAAKSDGLALYFALRLGYRPAAPGQAVWYSAARRDIIAMVRTPGGRD